MRTARVPKMHHPRLRPLVVLPLENNPVSDVLKYITHTLACLCGREKELWAAVGRQGWCVHGIHWRCGCGLFSGLGI